MERGLHLLAEQDVQLPRFHALGTLDCSTFSKPFEKSRQGLDSNCHVGARNRGEHGTVHLVNAVLLPPMNYPQPDAIVEVTRTWPGFGNAPAVTPTKFDFWRTGNDSFCCSPARIVANLLLAHA
jgi:hypothetical protein